MFNDATAAFAAPINKQTTTTVPNKLHLAVLGHGVVGSTFIQQVLQRVETLRERKNLEIIIFAVANSKKLLLDESGISADWKTNIAEATAYSNATVDIISFAQEHSLENLVLVDNTASEIAANDYEVYIGNGFNIVSSNKIANTGSLEDYVWLRKCLQENNKEYYYETNVGAGLPIIDNIKLLHLSGEYITQIKGVFSGSLSYIFNTYSKENAPISEVILRAKELGYTEPDPRTDLSGTDVARKLLVLARELDIAVNLDAVETESLIPKHLKDIPLEEFLNRIKELDEPFAKRKNDLKDGLVFRYVGSLTWDIAAEKETLTVKLEAVPENSSLGQLAGSDSLFEIYTESYGEKPFIIQGAGAGAEVTARGVFGDVLRIGSKI